MNMTKRQALIKTAKMWKWLSENPEFRKETYMDLNTINPRPKHSCYLCQYTIDIEGVLDCKQCPLLGRWKPKSKSKNTKCYTVGSVYNLYNANWYNERHEEITHYALQIYKICQSILEEMKNGKV